MIVGTKYITRGSETTSISVNGQATEIVNSQKHLGIIIDSNLTWEQQIRQVCIKRQS